mmetsp:Transcript_4067/g.7570  ORF Transcript_4067/g.7570 Transcript_4067/m.7570 type:complete len:216 (-) Transcript_4067:1301-1948(-)
MQLQQEDNAWEIPVATHTKIKNLHELAFLNATSLVKEVPLNSHPHNVVWPAQQQSVRPPSKRRALPTKCNCISFSSNIISNKARKFVALYDPPVVHHRIETLLHNRTAKTGRYRHNVRDQLQAVGLAWERCQRVLIMLPITTKPIIPSHHGYLRAVQRSPVILLCDRHLNHGNNVPTFILPHKTLELSVLEQGENGQYPQNQVPGTVVFLQRKGQ